MVALGLFQVYPKVKRDEALVNHGTEFPFSEAQKFGVLHQQFEVTNNVSLKFELVNGHYFSIISETQVYMMITHQSCLIKKLKMIS